MLKLERSYTSKGTFGLLTLPTQQVIVSVEPPWLNNRPMYSCIPEGLYQLRLDNFKHDYQNYRITNPPPGRFAIEIHRANRASELKGCIAPGMSLGYDWSITDSKIALDLLMESMGGQESGLLYITSYKPTFHPTEDS
jgi:Family of unknown function (DUF5675)